MDNKNKDIILKDIIIRLQSLEKKVGDLEDGIPEGFKLVTQRINKNTDNILEVAEAVDTILNASKKHTDSLQAQIFDIIDIMNTEIKPGRQRQLQKKSIDTFELTAKDIFKSLQRPRRR